MINMLLYQILICAIHGKTNHIKAINFKYHPQHGEKNFDLPDGSYSVSDILDYFEYIIKHMKK